MYGLVLKKVLEEKKKNKRRSVSAVRDIYIPKHGGEEA